MTIEEMQNNMTVFYRKKTGEIKTIIGGINDMSAFGAEQEDMELIWGYVVIPRDTYVINNSQNFIYDIETKELKIKQDAVPKYPVA
jgi:hypothetical protein